MSRPDIPGYYFDESRKRYFRITNGDQRQNSAYSNNAVRAHERRQQSEQKSCKRTKTRDVTLLLSKSAEMQANPTLFSNWLLRKRLAHVLGRPGLIQRTPSLSAPLKLLDHPSWPFSSGTEALVAKGASLELYSKFDFMRGCSSQAIAKLHISQDQSDHAHTKTQVERLVSSGDWVVCVYGGAFHLLQWQRDEGRETFNPRDYTERFRSGLISYATIRHIELSLPVALLESRLFPVFEKNMLVLYLDLGYKVETSLHPFCIQSVGKYEFNQRLSPNIDSRFFHQENSVYYNSTKYLVARNLSMNTKTWKFKSPVYGFYVVSIKPVSANERLQRCSRIYVITATEIIIRDFINSSFSATGPDTVIPVNNDNQARPLTYHHGQYIVVEEGDGMFKVVDTNLLITKTLNWRVKFASPRGTMPRLFELQDSVFMADSKQTFKLNHEIEMGL